MIVKNFVAVLILNVALICDVIGTSYSNVHVKSQVVPMEYYQYGTPYASIANPRLSDINSLPSLPGYVAPCETPCVYPAQTVATVTSMRSIPTYKVIPSVPVVVTPTKEETAGYEYSYVVYDENTGDHKAQRELSDGSVVQGEYSFLQPDGYVREVQYVADDISGFNAVVKNFLPVAPEGKRKDEAKDKDESLPPCNEIKSESLKEGSEDLKSNNPKEVLGELSEEKSTEKSKYSKEETGVEFEEKPKETLNKSKIISNEEPDKVPEENSKEKKLQESTELGSKDEKKSKKEFLVSYEEPGEGSESQKPKEELQEKTLKKNSKESEEESREKYKNKSKEAVGESSEGKLEEKVSYDKNKEAHELVKPKQETLVPYNDVLRCIQAAIRRNNGIPVAMRVEPSPLTYIVLNKPC